MEKEINTDFIEGTHILKPDNVVKKFEISKGVVLHVKKLMLSLLALPHFTRKSVYQLIKDVNLSECVDVRDAIYKWHSLGYISNCYSVEEFEIANLTAINIIKKSEKENIHIFTCFDNEFPESLKSIPDPPAIIYAKGNFTSLNNKHIKVAIVGSRKPSEHGIRFANELGHVFAKNGFDVVSGLALGCDTQAHLGCLDAGGITIAVMAEGLNYVYPSDNLQLSDRIISNGGCLLSEYPVGIQAKKWSFIERDRLQAGLSNGLLLIESSVEGGSMHTLNFTYKLGRPIAAINYPDGMRSADFNASGNDYAIMDMGAIPFMSGNELTVFVNKLQQ